MSPRRGMEQPDRPAAQHLREQMLAGLPIADRRMSLAGVPTAVLEGGEGPPIVLLHSSGEFAALWMRVVPDLVTTHRVVAPDLPAHGASAAAGVWDLGTTLAWISELIDHTCSSPPVLVGHGLGGAVAARFASNGDARLSGLILVDSFGLGPLEPEPSFHHAVTRFLEGPTERTRDDLFRQCFVDLDRLREQMGERWEPIAAYALDRVSTPGMNVALGSLMPLFGAEIPSTDLARIAVPTTLIWGRHDLQVPVRIAEAASARYGWPLHVIDDVGDDPAMERPEAFIEALRAGLTPLTRAEAGS
ncbi:MAG: alpha/beta fold hydrolase [Vicinamibacteraceae bacterium]